MGQIPIDVEKLHCDALCATGREYLRGGPRGTGFLYARKSRLEELEPPFLDLHAAPWTKLNEYQINKDATRFETWERNYSNLIGLKTAIGYASSWGLEHIWDRIRLLSIPRVQIRDLGEKKCGIVTFTIDGLDAAIVSEKLRQRQINTSVSLAEYARLDLEGRGVHSLVRSSVHYYNTDEEIERFCQEVAMLAIGKPDRDLF